MFKHRCGIVAVFKLRSRKVNEIKRSSKMMLRNKKEKKNKPSTKDIIHLTNEMDLVIERQDNQRNIVDGFSP